MKKIVFPFLLFMIFTVHYSFAQSVSDTFEGSVSAGIALPFGNFSYVDGKNPGYAQFGGVLLFDARFILDKKIAWISTVAISFNPVDRNSMISSDGVAPPESDQYIQSWLLSGVGFELNASTVTRVYANFQMGVFLGQYPELEFNNDGSVDGVSTDLATTLGIALGTGIKYDPFTFGLKFLWAEPEYKHTFSSKGNDYKVYNQTLSTSLIFFTVGYIF